MSMPLDARSPRPPLFTAFRLLTPAQRHAFVACFLGWSLDAFDYFLLVFCVPAISADFHAKTSSVAEALFLTLAFALWAHSCSGCWPTGMGANRR